MTRSRPPRERDGAIQSTLRDVASWVASVLGGVDDDIWFAKDRDKDGDLLDAGEGIGRWASNGTVGSEFTGLYFDPTNKRRAWVNIQHPASGNDRTIEITVP